MMNLIRAKEKEGGEQGSVETAVSNGNTTRDATTWLLGDPSWDNHRLLRCKRNFRNYATLASGLIPTTVTNSCESPLGLDNSGGEFFSPFLY